MTSEDDLTDIEFAIAEYAEELRERDEKEALLNAQMHSIRLEIAKLRDTRYEITKKIRETNKTKESVLRKVELEKQAAIVTASLEEKRREAEEILANAPWRSDAWVKLCLLLSGVGCRVLKELSFASVVRWLPTLLKNLISASLVFLSTLL
jgi:septal ring factor EnvC (AmiA/AmiB activator)